MQISKLLRTEKGFSLIELVMVIAISGILSGFISNIIFYEINIYEIVTSRKEAGQNSRFALQMISREIRQIVEPDSILYASHDSLRFVDVGGGRILYRHTNASVFRNSDILLDGVSAFEFNYFNEDGNLLAIPLADLSAVRRVTLALKTDIRGQNVSSKISVTPRNFQ